MKRIAFVIGIVSSLLLAFAAAHGAFLRSVVTKTNG